MSKRTRTRAGTTTGARRLGRGLVAAGGAALLTFGVSACGDTAGSEEGASVEDVQEDVQDDEGLVEDEAPAEDEVGLAGEENEVVGDDVSYVYDGDYDSVFYDELDTYVGEEVTLSADVNEVLGDSAFTIAGTDDTSVDEFLVVGADGTEELEPGLTVQVTGIVEETFDVVGVEEELGVDLDDSLYNDWEGEGYLVATAVDTSVASDQ